QAETHIVYVVQAEDGIRGRNVTGVQTCALPILTDSKTEPHRSSWQSAITALSARAVSTVKRSPTKIEGTTPTLTPDIFTSRKAWAVLDPIVIKNHRIPFTKPLNRC